MGDMGSQNWGRYEDDLKMIRRWYEDGMKIVN
jgi:hypothetical protein